MGASGGRAGRRADYRWNTESCSSDSVSVLRPESRHTWTVYTPGSRASAPSSAHSSKSSAVSRQTLATISLASRSG